MWTSPAASLMEYFKSIAKILLGVALSVCCGCCSGSHQKFIGPKAILVYPKVEGADGGFLTCKSGEMWREGGKYAIRFESRYDGRSNTIELHGLDRILIPDESVANGACS